MNENPVPRRMYVKRGEVPSPLKSRGEVPRRRIRAGDSISLPAPDPRKPSPMRCDGMRVLLPSYQKGMEGITVLLGYKWYCST